MVTLLDVFLLGKLTPVFIFLLTFVIVYAVLQLTNFLKDKNLNAIIAFIFAFLTLLNPKFMELIKIIIPWLFLMLLIGIFIMVGLLSLGTPSSGIQKVMGKWGTPHAVFLGFLGFIMLIAFSQVYGDFFMSATNPEASNTTQNSVIAEATRIFFTPQVLGFSALILIMMFAVIFLTYSPVSKK